MDKLDKKTMERIIKAVVNWNKQKATFSKRFLELQDYTELSVEINGDVITLTTKFKEDM